MRRSTRDNGKVRDLLVEAAGAAYLWSNYYQEGSCYRWRSSSRRDNSNIRDLLVEAAGAAYLWSNYYVGKAAVGEITATSGTCWFVVKEQGSSG